MSRVLLNREPLPINYERTTKATWDTPLTSKQLCYALLDPSEFATCQREREEIIIKGHAFPAESPDINKDILSVIKPECLGNGDVTLRDTSTFSFARARAYIQNKFGVSGFTIIGNRNHIVGIRVSSFVSHVDPEVHVKRYANILRAIKQIHPKLHVTDLDCQTSAPCDPRLTKLLHELLSEKNPQQIVKEIVQNE